MLKKQKRRRPKKISDSNFLRRLKSNQNRRKLASDDLHVSSDQTVGQPEQTKPMHPNCGRRAFPRHRLGREHESDRKLSLTVEASRQLNSQRHFPIRRISDKVENRLESSAQIDSDLNSNSNVIPDAKAIPDANVIPDEITNPEADSDPNAIFKRGILQSYKNSGSNISTSVSTKADRCFSAKHSPLKVPRCQQYTALVTKPSDYSRTVGRRDHPSSATPSNCFRDERELTWMTHLKFHRRISGFVSSFVFLAISTSFLLPSTKADLGE